MFWQQRQEFQEQKLDRWYRHGT